MSRRAGITLAVLLVAAVGTAIALIAAHLGRGAVHERVPGTGAAVVRAPAGSTPLAGSSGSGGSGGASESGGSGGPAGSAGGTLRAAELRAAAGYAAYLDGAPVSRFAPAGITARAQATAAGRIPAAFRDGPLRVISASADATAFSAEVSVVLANREERYPCALQLLREQHGWEATGLQPPDLAMDDDTRPPPAAAAAPAAGRAAARRLALAYLSFRSGAGAGRPPVGFVLDAAVAIRRRRDPLAGLRPARARPRLEQVAFGPPAGGRFAVTVTARVAAAQVRFSLLVAAGPAGWRCTAFL